jgi:hypothetical protein
VATLAVDPFVFSPTATLVFNNQIQGPTLSGAAFTDFKTFADTGGAGMLIQSSLATSSFFRF